MSFPKSKVLRIAAPCHESWEQMSVSEKRRFCASCEQEVTDFTEMDDEELLAAIKTNGFGCGRFRRSQLNRELQEQPFRTLRKIRFRWPEIAAAVIALCGTAGVGFGQTKQKVSTSVHQASATRLSGKYVQISGSVSFAGRLQLSEVAGRKIRLSSGFIYLVAELQADGRFEFLVPPKSQKGKATISLVDESWLGWKPKQEIVVPLNVSSFGNVLLCERQVVEMNIDETVQGALVTNPYISFSSLAENQISAVDRRNSGNQKTGPFQIIRPVPRSLPESKQAPKRNIFLRIFGKAR